MQKQAKSAKKKSVFAFVDKDKPKQNANLKEFIASSSVANKKNAESIKDSSVQELQAKREKMESNVEVEKPKKLGRPKSDTNEKK